MSGNIYFSQPDPKTKKTRLYRSQLLEGAYTTPEPLSFSDGVISDYDAAVSPDESFIIFSSTRPPTPKQQSGIFMVFSKGGHWETPIPFQPFLLGTKSRLSPDLKTLYFATDQPTLETSAAMQNASSTSSSGMPDRIWQVSLKMSSRP